MTPSTAPKTKFLHYAPDEGFVGDVIPFYRDGVYHAFYLRRRPGRGTSYGHARSTDLVNWEELPDAIDVGGPDEPDAVNCFTGCVVERDGVGYLFYTGFAPGSKRFPRETTCLATSTDFVHWTKAADNPILTSDERWYERDDWRDPYIFWHEEEGQYWMLLCARDRTNPGPMCGCLGLAKSKDLTTWVAHPPLWTPNMIPGAECPDTFEAGGRRYLIYSLMETRYRSAPSWDGPWTFEGATEQVDGMRFYAAKCFHNGDRHLLAGWVSSHEGLTDNGKIEWGGHLGMIRELEPTPGGGLRLKAPPEVRDAFSTPFLDLADAEPVAHSPSWERTPAGLRASAIDGMAITRFRAGPKDYRATMRLRLEGGNAQAGLMIRLSDDMHEGYMVAIDAGVRQVVVKKLKWQTYGEPQMEVARPIRLSPGEPVTVETYVHDSIIEVFVNDETVATARAYDNPQGGLALFAANGAATFESLTIHTP